MPSRETAPALARQAARILKARGLTFAVAEGTTGGRIGELLVRSPGASAYFKGAVVTYDYASRTNLLGIDAAFVERHGAVSEEVVRPMASAVRERFGVDVGLASTGVAGPAGGTAAKPIGLVWLAVATPNGIVAREHRLPPATRYRLQAQFTKLALQLVIDVLDAP